VTEPGETPAADEIPPRPEPVEPDTAWEHYPLWERVVDALLAMPAHFTSPLSINGVVVQDLFALNSSLGASIEDHRRDRSTS